MKVTQIQMDIKWGDINYNCNVASQLIDSVPGSDLYILPEMFSTGFATEPEGMADTTDKTLAWMQQKAESTGAAICGSCPILISLPSEVSRTYRNRFYFVKPQNALSPLGESERVTFYDKRHLFTYGGEDRHYTPGKERVIVEWQGVRFLLQICYDLRFPCFARNEYMPFPLVEGRREASYDAILYVASWPTSRIDVWHTLLKARAIENQCYVFGVNRVGEDKVCSYQGGTQSIDPYGRIIASCPDNQQSTITTELDMEELVRFRKKFPVLLDADGNNK